MDNQLLIEQLHFVKGLDPVADAFAATVVSDVVNMKDYDRVCWVIYKGVGNVGTSTVKVLACLDVTPTASTAVAFHYRVIGTDDVEGALGSGTAASGFVTTAASSELYAIEVDAATIMKTGYQYAQLQMVTAAVGAVLGGVLCIMGGPHYALPIKASVIV